MTFDAYSFREDHVIKRQCPKCKQIINFNIASTWYSHLEHCKGNTTKQTTKEDNERKQQLQNSLKEFKRMYKIK